MEKGASSSKLLNDREIEVCNILLNLKKMIRKYESSPPNFNWGNKRLRSTLRKPRRHLDFVSRFLRDERKGRSEGKVVSPNSPLLFSSEPLDHCSSGSDKKLMQSHKKNSKKRMRKYLLEIEKLEKNKEDLKREIEVVKNYHSKLTALNLEMKAKKNQFCPIENKDRSPLHHVDNYQPLKSDPTAQTGPTNTIPNTGCQSSHQGLDIDLNVPLDPFWMN